VLTHKPDPEDELIVICKVLFWENTIEKTWPQAIEIEQGLPSFVTAG
jgi:hypothetical protein